MRTNSEDKSTIKKFLLGILDYLHYQIENDKCTMQEMKSFANMITDNSDIDVTAKDLSQHFGESEVNVRSVLNRGFMRKQPKRRVYYSLASFMNIMPKNWFTNDTRY